MNTPFKTLKYPLDRVDGFVLLECGGKTFCPNFKKLSLERTEWLGYVKHWRAWSSLVKGAYGKNYEPSALSNFKNHM